MKKLSQEVCEEMRHLFDCVMLWLMIQIGLAIGLFEDEEKLEWHV